MMNHKCTICGKRMDSKRRDKIHFCSEPCADEWAKRIQAEEPMTSPNAKDLERAREIVEQAKAQDSCDVYDSLVTDFAAALAAVREEFKYSIHAQQAIYETLCEKLQKAESQLATVRNGALEEAARIADRNDMSAWGIAAVIRVLKAQTTGENKEG